MSKRYCNARVVRVLNRIGAWKPFRADTSWDEVDWEVLRDPKRWNWSPPNVSKLDWPPTDWRDALRRMKGVGQATIDSIGEALDLRGSVRRVVYVAECSCGTRGASVSSEHEAASRVWSSGVCSCVSAQSVMSVHAVAYQAKPVDWQSFSVDGDVLCRGCEEAK